MKAKSGCLVLLIAAFLWYSYAPRAAGADIPGGRRTAPEAISLQRGIDLYGEGRTEEALTLLRGFVVRNYSSPLLPRAYLYMARIFRDQGRPDEALLYLSRIPPAQRNAQIQLIEGASLIETGRIENGLNNLWQVPAAELEAADRSLLYTTLAEGSAKLGRSLQALVFFHQAMGVAPAGEGSKALEQVHLLLKDRLSDAELEEASFMFAGTPIGEDANLQRAQRAFSMGERDRARLLLEEVMGSRVAFPYRGEAALLYDRLVGNEWLQRAVGVILPLSGRYAAFGQLVRRGMELGLEMHNQANSPVNFLFRDAGADPDQSSRAVSELANGERVMAIAGPLTGAAAASAATRAQQERVPLLTLSQREGLPEIGHYVFRNSLTNALQVQTLVRYAVEVQGFSSFGILHPENRLGAEMADLFTRAVESYGAEVTHLQSYPEKATDFRRQIKLLMGLDPDAPEEEKPKDPPEDLVVPGESAVAFEALFIPDYADQVSLIAPQLAFYGIEKLPLLGINGWNSPELLRVAGRYVEGAVFVDGFFRQSPSPLVREFVALYMAKYGEEPSILEAQGFDAAGILLSILDRPEVRSRQDFWRVLIDLRDYPGVTGLTSIDELGDSKKELFLLQVKNGNIVQIN